MLLSQNTSLIVYLKFSYPKAFCEIKASAPSLSRTLLIILLNSSIGNTTSLFVSPAKSIAYLVFPDDNFLKTLEYSLEKLGRISFTFA